MSTNPPKQTHNLSSLPTQSVVLYPSKAHITRQINNIPLKPGTTNEVEILGLSPTVDEHSIQVEAIGNAGASIADIAVQLVPNGEVFEEVYPDEDDEEEEDDSDEESGDEDEVVKSLEEQLRDLHAKKESAFESQRSANERLATWDRYAKAVSPKHFTPTEMGELLGKYGDDRAKIFDVKAEAAKTLEELERQIEKTEKEKERAGKAAKKEREKREKAREKERRRRALKRAEREKEKLYRKQERLRYWPTKVYKVTLLLELSSLDTPNSSRRNSLGSVTLASSPPMHDEKGKDPEDAASVSLLLSYVTRDAGWLPRFDLRISSLKKTATIIYRTEFFNHSSETWKDAKLSFSTSQTSYQGLDDVVPYMHPWHVKLDPIYGNVRATGGLLSPEEQEHKNRGERANEETFDRAEVFAWNGDLESVWASKRPLNAVKEMEADVANLENFTSSMLNSGRALKSIMPGGSASQADGRQSALRPEIEVVSAAGEHLHSVPSSLTGTVTRGFGGASMKKAKKSSFALPMPSLSRRPNKAGPPQAIPPPPPAPYQATGDLEKSYVDAASSAQDEDGSDSEDNNGDEDSSWEDNGLTTTYDVPGPRTLSPSSLTRRHKLASLHASNITLSYICVPKLRAAAFLRAKIRNPSSSIALLKGSAGVTLDGSFLGVMDLPRVSPGQIFEVSLGVDPAVHVNYPKPSVVRGTQGVLFNKERAQVFSRAIWINNTRGQAIDIHVLDQVPVSEDEKLRITVLAPKGLVKAGDAVKAGVSAKEGSSGVAMTETKDNKENWGNATARLKKGGEVSWMVKLEGRKGCKLGLQYETRFPGGRVAIVPAWGM